MCEALCPCANALGADAADIVCLGLMTRRIPATRTSPPFLLFVTAAAIVERNRRVGWGNGSGGRRGPTHAARQRWAPARLAGVVPMGSVLRSGLGADRRHILRPGSLLHRPT